MSVPQVMQSDSGKPHTFYKALEGLTDDITILTMAFAGTPDGPAEQLEFTIRNHLEEVGKALSTIGGFATDHGVDDAARRPAMLALDDLLNNVISYAFGEPGTHEIQIAVEISTTRFTITITDDGAPFNPFGAETPDVSAALTDGEIGGLGIHLVKQLMDEYHYDRRSGRNVVTVAMRLQTSDEERQ